MNKKKVTAKDLAKEAELLMVDAIKQKIEQRIAGDETATPSTDEMSFLQTVIKSAQEGEQADAVVSYLSEMDQDDLDKYHDQLFQSLEDEIEEEGRLN